MKTIVTIPSHDLLLLAARAAMARPENRGKHHAATAMCFDMSKENPEERVWVEVTMFQTEQAAKEYIFDEKVAETIAPPVAPDAGTTEGGTSGKSA